MANYIYRDKDHHHDIDCPHLSRLVRSEEKRRARNRRGGNRLINASSIMRSPTKTAKFPKLKPNRSNQSLSRRVCAR
jgi:hypothetical protein